MSETDRNKWQMRNLYPDADQNAQIEKVKLNWYCVLNTNQPTGRSGTTNQTNRRVQASKTNSFCPHRTGMSVLRWTDSPPIPKKIAGNTWASHHVARAAQKTVSSVSWNHLLFLELYDISNMQKNSLKISLDILKSLSFLSGPKQSTEAESTPRSRQKMPKPESKAGLD